VRRISCDKCGKKLLDGDPNRAVVKLARGQSLRSRTLADMCHQCSVLLVDFVTSGRPGKRPKGAEAADIPAEPVTAGRRRRTVGTGA